MRTNRTLLSLGLLISILGAPTVVFSQEVAAADAVAVAFVNARQGAGLSKLKRMGRNTFGDKICKHDMRFPSGLINSVSYQTSEPSILSESAQRLAVAVDTGKTAARFGIGVCLVTPTSAGQPVYSIFIATYESRPTSFWRIFWE
jgi:hypothetical protein